MPDVERHFNEPEGHRRIELICPVPSCRKKFALNPSDFASRKRKSPNGLICCGMACKIELRHHPIQTRGAVPPMPTCSPAGDNPHATPAGRAFCKNPEGH